MHSWQRKGFDFKSGKTTILIIVVTVLLLILIMWMSHVMIEEIERRMPEMG